MYNDLLRPNALVSYGKSGERTKILAYLYELERKNDSRHRKPKTTVATMEIEVLIKGGMTKP